ncbi:MAG: hypothetical protein AAGJ35_10720 [Myxococcota bacterium]
MQRSFWSGDVHSPEVRLYAQRVRKMLPLVRGRWEKHMRRCWGVDAQRVMLRFRVALFPGRPPACTLLGAKLYGRPFLEPVWRTFLRSRAQSKRKRMSSRMQSFRAQSLWIRRFARAQRGHRKGCFRQCPSWLPVYEGHKPAIWFWVWSWRSKSSGKQLGPMPSSQTIRKDTSSLPRSQPTSKSNSVAPRSQPIGKDTSSLPRSQTIRKVISQATRRAR